MDKHSKRPLSAFTSRLGVERLENRVMLTRFGFSGTVTEIFPLFNGGHYPPSIQVGTPVIGYYAAEGSALSEFEFKMGNVEIRVTSGLQIDVDSGGATFVTGWTNSPPGYVGAPADFPPFAQIEFAKGSNTGFLDWEGGWVDRDPVTGIWIGESQIVMGVQIETCPVSDFTTSHENLPEDDPNNITAELAAAVATFQASVAAQPGQQTATVTTGYRSIERQTHLYEINTQFKKLIAPSIDGIEGFVATIAGKQRPQLRLRASPHPSAKAMACVPLMEKVNDEVLTHLLKPNSLGRPAVNPPENSLHTLDPAQAVDISISAGVDSETIDQLVIDQLVIDAGLYRPFPGDDVHYQLGASASPPVQSTFTGNSPINLLLTDSDGKRIGFDRSTGIAVNDFGALAEYSGSGSEPQVISIWSTGAQAQSYQISGVGTGAGPYTITVDIYGDDPTTSIYAKRLTDGITTANEPIPPTRPINLFAAATKAWQNPFDSRDINDDGRVVPIDVLLIFNEVNSPKHRSATGKLPSTRGDIFFYFDVNGDGFATALDALSIINKLNNSMEAESEASRSLNVFGQDYLVIENPLSAYRTSIAHYYSDLRTSDDIVGGHKPTDWQTHSAILTSSFADRQLHWMVRPICYEPWDELEKLIDEIAVSNLDREIFSSAWGSSFVFCFLDGTSRQERYSITKNKA